ncbi:cytochrome d ubiquinol oxidase subunit II [Phaeodactylibacter luteus]|uniref:Cytochrome d ubiquinol oxidase subunit II n=1 Tax=Phaeodactylibacter luteus TaxID=1564516 RepID=A0A5C6RL04_9BACT|nr:cytochrome d ubiquinol oxidase subunit II [Phaeodactylibacter luteus]TXB62625.1 cytochrome d ubiquinol oxidase subunit II [Phaeodactylibacter luteus]
MATFLGIDYPTLWFLVIGALFSGYAILDGFDLGAGALHLFFKKEQSRRIALNAIGPVWDGNEVWLVIAGGALFAGFPNVYATLFSAMYIPFMLFLAFLIFRAVSIEFRSKEKMKWWRQMWDVNYSIASTMLAFLLGVVLGNVLLGIELGPSGEFEGSWLTFLNPYALLVGLTTLALFTMHGALYLLMKTEGRLYAKLSILAKRSMIFFIVTFALATLYTLIYIPHLTDRFKELPWLFVIPVLAFLSIANIPRLISKRSYRGGFIFSALTMSLLLIVVAIELYPDMLLSTVDEAYNLTVYNAASSEKSLGIMLTFAAVGTPLVLSYTAFVFWTFRGKVQLDENSY